MLKKLLFTISLLVCLPAFSGAYEDAFKSSDKVFLYFYTNDCGYCIKFNPIYEKVEEKFCNLNYPITIATMGCPVNGPKEAAGADYGIAGAIGEGYIFKKGEIIKKVPEKDLLLELENIIKLDLNIDKIL